MGVCVVLWGGDDQDDFSGCLIRSFSPPGLLMNLKYYVSPYDLFEDGTGAPVVLHENSGRSAVENSAGGCCCWKEGRKQNSSPASAVTLSSRTITGQSLNPVGLMSPGDHWPLDLVAVLELGLAPVGYWGL